ncbi:helix-hairpin-helix domain-containing protein [Streptomyces sp. WMMB 322]|uniref:helix-hairpin-helix domain-containing protein n=1 Tax=Streptomyces sp. WMMB 322 TaxID=1286821 RepID=UPI0006E23EB1|nr:helix-hairpin-helix domain-containing protein [Streptomyces sp. WMMB 322]SCK53937.1 UvrD-like helicase C-terminal domain-containing protein [Streptomyces sp. WMMB 322]
MTDDKAAELLAAVRAVESGERSAASFFTEPGKPQAAPRPEPSAAPRPAPADVAARRGPAAVPDGLREVLAEGGAPEALAPRVAEVLGDRSGDLLRSDPWQLLAVPGVRPEQADGFARALLGEAGGPGDERRTRALVLWLLERAALAGHTALEPAALAKGLSGYAVPEPDEAVRSAVDAGAVLVFEDALDTMPQGALPAAGQDEQEAGEARPVRILLGLDHCALAEESLADGLGRVISTAARPGAPGERGPDEWESAAAGAPSASAAELIRAVAGHALVVHTGGEAARAEPAALLTAAGQLGLRACAAAHTAGGRERLARLMPDPDRAESAASERPRHPVVTVAGLLDGREGPGRDGEGAWALDLLIVCDAPQLDAETAAALVESLPDGARLVLSGDPNVLGSSGPGQVFADVLASGSCPHIASRTPDPGPVGELVSGISIGELNQVDAPGKEVVIVPVRDAGEAVHRTVQLVADSVPRAIGVPSGDTQVITTGHGGAAGTRALNAALKERLHPGPGRFDGFDPGDRVVHTPSRGRATPAVVVSGEEEGLRLEHLSTGERVVVARDRVADEVRHGWAVTAHQAVGMNWPAVVAVLPGDAAGDLTREWVYTAFGRAERHLSVVHGVEDALPKAVASVTAPARTTRLRALLTQSARAAEAARTAQAGRGAAGMQDDQPQVGPA